MQVSPKFPEFLEKGLQRRRISGLGGDSSRSHKKEADDSGDTHPVDVSEILMVLGRR